MTNILVFEEKHGPRYFHAESEQQVNAVFLKIIQQRLAEGWYEDTHDITGKSVTQDRNQLDLLAIKILSVKEYAQTLLQMEDSDHRTNLLERFMYSRKNAEYENWHFSTVEKEK